MARVIRGFAPEPSNKAKQSFRIADFGKSEARHGEGCVEPADPPIIQDGFGISVRAH